MKTSYITPSITTISVNATPLLNISGGGKGNEGDHGDSKRFWGSSIFDEDEDAEEDVE